MTSAAPATGNRRPPLWATVLATAGGAGFMPKAPGHTGTLVAVPLAWALGRLGPLGFIGGLVVVTAVGTWAASVFVRATGRDDDQRIVIDEVAGYLVTLLFVARTPVNLFCGYFLFRLFDVWKPQPVRLVDEKVGGGWGVMADDLAAGVYAGAILFTLDHFSVVERLLVWVRARA
jgi:phosphatidylglycerophosphatase A